MVQALLILGLESIKEPHMVQKLNKKTSLSDLLLPVMIEAVMIQESVIQL
jgi:hypothetical protein